MPTITGGLGDGDGPSRYEETLRRQAQNLIRIAWNAYETYGPTEALGAQWLIKELGLKSSCTNPMRRLYDLMTIAAPEFARQHKGYSLIRPGDGRWLVTADPEVTSKDVRRRSKTACTKVQRVARDAETVLINTDDPMLQAEMRLHMGVGSFYAQVFPQYIKKPLSRSSD